jgi:hypothetical protein
MDTTKLGFHVYDIRDFFNTSFVNEYEASVIKVREYFSQALERCTKQLPYADGCPSWNRDFIEHMDNLLDSDYSYLYEETYYHKETDKNWPLMDYNFVKDCFEYYDKHNIDETTTNDIVPGLSTISNGFYHQCAFAGIESLEEIKKTRESEKDTIIIDYMLMNDDINFKLLKLSFDGDELPIECKEGDWVESEKDIINSEFSKRRTWLNVLENKYFHPIHQDSMAQTRKFTCLNYPNIGRTLEDGALFRFYIDETEKSYMPNNTTEKNSYQEALCNYTTVIILNHTIDNDIVGKLYHQVTKNLGEVRYNVYNTFFT